MSKINKLECFGKQLVESLMKSLRGRYLRNKKQRPTVNSSNTNEWKGKIEIVSYSVEKIQTNKFL